MKETNCPITIFYEENESPYVSNVVYDLIPALKQLNFKNLAIEEIGNLNKQNLLIRYKFFAVLHLASAPGSNDNHLATYRLLSEANKYQFDIKSIDLQSMSAYQGLFISYKNFNQRFNNIFATSINQLNKNGDTSLSATYADSDGKILIETSAKLQTKSLIDSTTDDDAPEQDLKRQIISDIYSIKDIKHNYKLRFEHKFITVRNQNFIQNIEKICNDKDSGILAILTNSHYTISQTLEEKGYDVRSYYIGNSLTVDSFASFIKYAPDILESSATKIKFFDITEQPLAQIYGIIEQDLVDHFS